MTAAGNTPISIPCADPDNTLKKKSFSFSSVVPLNVTGMFSDALRAYSSLRTACDSFVAHF